MMKLLRTTILTIMAIAIVSCSSEAQWTDPEAHENTELLQEESRPLMVGQWHFERVSELHRYFEQLTFNTDNTFTGCRKWQSRSIVRVDGKTVYTDWEDVDELVGNFSGTWSLAWLRAEGHIGANYLMLNVTSSDSEYNINHYLLHFDHVDDKTLRIKCQYINDTDGWSNFERGEASPSF